MEEPLDPHVWKHGQSNFKRDRQSLLDVKAKRQADRDSAWLAVCKQVDKRDQWKCRACGVHVVPDAIDPLDRGHRHHLTFRSKGGQDVASNLVLVCARDHDAIHVKRSLRLEPQTPHGADGPLAIYRTVNGKEYLSRREVAIHRVEAD